MNSVTPVIAAYEQFKELSPEEIAYVNLVLDGVNPPEAERQAKAPGAGKRRPVIEAIQSRLVLANVDIPPSMDREQWLAQLRRLAFRGTQWDKIKLDALREIGKAEGWYEQLAETATDPLVTFWLAQLSARVISMEQVPSLLREAVEGAYREYLGEDSATLELGPPA